MVDATSQQIVRLEIILDQIQQVEMETAGLSFADFAASRALSDLAAFRVQVIGENCHHLPDELKIRHPTLPWNDIYGMRNIIAHHYGLINPATVWNVARDYLGAVKAMARTEIARAINPPSARAIKLDLLLL